MDKISQAAQTGVWLAAKQPVHIPISNRLDHLLEEIERDSSHRPTKDHDATTLGSKKLYIDGEEVTLSQQELDGLLVLKQFHWLLSQYNDSPANLDTIIHSQSSTTEASSPIDRLKEYLIDSGVISDGHSGFITQTGIDNVGIDVEDPSTLPTVHILELILLANEVEISTEKYNQQNPTLDKDILEQQYITSGVEGGVSDSSRTIHNELDFFDEDEGEEFAKYLAEVSAGERDDPLSSTKYDEDVNQFESSLVNALAADTETNIAALKADVDETNNDIESAQIHLINYKEFIEKKRKQRIQCLRDMKLHCCKCRGPHISKPPFSHGKDYRKDPAHPQHQGNNCLFLKKKRAELKWLDETIGSYDKNVCRFEQDIERHKAEAKSRQERMTEALTYSLRLMEIAADD